MTRARDLSRLGNNNAITASSTNNIGIGSTLPDSKLDVVGNANFTGVLTATSFVGDGSGITGVAATANVVTDSLVVIGVSTFNGAAGFDTHVDLPDNARLRLGDSDDLQIYHNGTHSFIQDEGTGNLYIDANQLYLRNADTDTVLLQTTSAGAVQMKYNGTTRFQTISTGATVTGDLYATTLYGDGSNLTGIAAGGSGTFDTGISTSVIVSVTGGIGTNDAKNRDIFVGPGIAYSFPSTASTQYVIESIHVVNKSGGNLYVSGRHDINGGANVPLANRVIVPYNGAVELLEEPHVANLSDVIRLQALTGTGTSATGANNGLDAFITYSTKSDSSDYIGVAQTITSTDQEFFEVASNPCVLQSLNLVNYSNNVDVDVSVSVFSGGTTGGIATTGIRRGYLTYNMTVPRNSTIEVLEKPKRLESNQSLLITASSNNTIGVVLSGKYITS